MVMSAAHLPIVEACNHCWSGKAANKCYRCIASRGCLHRLLPSASRCHSLLAKHGRYEQLLDAKCIMPDERIVSM